MKKVLIAIDYNPCAQKVAEMGYKHARAMNAEICIVHAVADRAYYSWQYSPIMGFTVSVDSLFKNIEEQKKEAENFLAAVVKYLADDNIKTKVLDDKTAESILSYIAEWKADLLVIGAQSHNGFEKLLMGDVAAKLLKNAEIPILMIPTDKQDLNNLSQKQNLVQQF